MNVSEIPNRDTSLSHSLLMTHELLSVEKQRFSEAENCKVLLNICERENCIGSLDTDLKVGSVLVCL